MSNLIRRRHIRLLSLCYLFNELSSRYPEIGLDLSRLDMDNPLTYQRIPCKSQVCDVDIVLENTMNSQYITLMSPRANSHDPLGENSFQPTIGKYKEYEPALTMFALAVQIPIDVSYYLSLETHELSNLTDYDYECLAHKTKESLILFRYEMITKAKEEILRLEQEIDKLNKITDLCEKVLNKG